MESDVPAILPGEIEKKIHAVRGQSVLLDRDLAAHDEVEVKVLNQAVRRQRERFPNDFMFESSPEESAALRSQIVTSKPRGPRTRRTIGFTAKKP